jgi:hypothetical protein
VWQRLQLLGGSDRFKWEFATAVLKFCWWQRAGNGS